MNTFEELIKALDCEDDLGKVVRSHVIIENIIVMFIESRLKNKTYLKKMGLTFEQKTNLALALGLDKNWSQPLSCLGNIRNSFAHNLRGEINKSDANNFYKSFSTRDKEIMHNLYNENEEELKGYGYPSYKNFEPVHKFSLCVTILAGALQVFLKNEKKPNH